MNRRKYLNEEQMLNRRYGPKKTIDPDAYASELNVRVKKNIFLQNVNSFEILEKELKEQELNGANFIISYFDDPSLNQLFLLDRELKDANLKEICKQKRETAMKVIFDRYVEKSINEEVVAPKVEITDLFNIITMLFMLEILKIKILIFSFLSAKLLEIITNIKHLNKLKIKLVFLQLKLIMLNIRMFHLLNIQ